MPTPTDVRKRALSLQGRIRAARKTPNDPSEDPSDPIALLSGPVPGSPPKPKSRLDKALDIALDTVEDKQREEVNAPSGPSLLQAEDKAARRVTDMLASVFPKTMYGMGKDLIVAKLKSLQGRILTIVDASFQDPEQRKAVKTLVSKEFRLEMTRVSDFFGDDEGYGEQGP
jgi:hypothetical protein